jgi:hypothetical protein
MFVFPISRHRTVGVSLKHIPIEMKNHANPEEKMLPAASYPRRASERYL